MRDIEQRKVTVWQIFIGDGVMHIEIRKRMKKWRKKKELIR